MRAFFDRTLETAATFWRIYRRDGVCFGFTSHDRDLIFGGIRHRASPGMAPAAIRMTSDLSEDNAGVSGALSHDAISESDLAGGLFDRAAIEIGIVDWETLDHRTVYTGTLGRIEDDGRGFSSELRSAKEALEQDLVPRTSPTCRAAFCGPGCGLSAARFMHRARLQAFDADANRVRFGGLKPGDFIDGQVRFLSGPQTGIAFVIVDATAEWLTLDRPLDAATAIGIMAEIREGCDHTLATCNARFNNAINFRGEPFLPGNDLLARYGSSNG